MIMIFVIYCSFYPDDYDFCHLMQLLSWWLWFLLFTAAFVLIIMIFVFNADFVLMIMIFVIYCSFYPDDYDFCYLLQQRLFW